MPKKKVPSEWVRPDGLTLKEMQERLPWFGVNVSLDGLRQTVSALNIPVRVDRGPKGRGQTGYLDYEAMWMVAASYRRVTGRRDKFETIAKDLRAREAARPERFSISGFFEDGSPETAREIKWLRRVYLEFACDPAEGLDLRVVTNVARDHWADVGLDHKDLADQVLLYKRQTLARTGVPQHIAEQVQLA